MKIFETTKEERNFYNENGYLLVDGVFTEAEMEECSKEYDHLFELKRKERCQMEATWKGDWSEDKVKDKMSVLSIHSLECHSSLFTRMLLNTKLLNIVSELMESDTILLHHTKAHLKPPSVGAPFPVHQDYPYFPFKKHSLMACFINFDDSEPENGGLAVYPGSHKLGPLPSVSTSPGHYYVNQDQFPINGATPIRAKRGQVILFPYFLVHGSYPNASDRTRRMLLFQFMSGEDEPTKQVHISPCQGMVLKGCNIRPDIFGSLRRESKMIESQHA